MSDEEQALFSDFIAVLAVCLILGAVIGVAVYAVETGLSDVGRAIGQALTSAIQGP